MEKRQQVLLSYYLTLLIQLGGGVFFLLLMAASIWFNIDQNQRIQSLEKEVNGSSSEMDALHKQLEQTSAELKTAEAEITSLKAEKQGLAENESLLSRRLVLVDSKIRSFLDSQHKTCLNETSECLDEMIVLLTPVAPVCSGTKDSICPQNCTLSDDFDCCIAKGYRWVAGKGCYSPSRRAA